MPRKITPTPLQFDEHGLPLGVAMFPAEEVAKLLSVTPRQLKRWRLSNPPVLRAEHPSGPKAPALYRRSELVRFLTK